MTASLLRTVLVVASIVAVGSATSAFTVSNAPTDAPSSLSPSLALPIPSVAIAPQPAAGTEIVSVSSPEAECSQFLADFCEEAPRPAPKVTALADPSSCRMRAEHRPQGSTSVVPAAAATAAGPAPAMRYQLEIEDGLAVNPECFATSIAEILNDPRGWAGTGEPRFEQVSSGEYDFRLILASPSTTDALCYPAGTGGKYSCRNRNKVVLNLMRWEEGTDEFTGPQYRQYLVNHEVGHLLGHGHESCPGPGAIAPVMMQQTKGLDGCLPNGWPMEDER